MPAIPESFFVPLATARGTTVVPARFEHLLGIDDAGRYALLRGLAQTLAFLHGHGVCIGDISPKNLLFSLTPRPAVYLIDCDAMRINGMCASAQVETPGWEVPAGEELATVYSDSYKLALVALRLLVGDQNATNPRFLPAQTPDLLRQLISDTLTNPPQSRPLAPAWSQVLGHAIETAQHQASSPPIESFAETGPASSAPQRISPMVVALVAVVGIIIVAVVAIRMVIKDTAGPQQATSTTVLTAPAVPTPAMVPAPAGAEPTTVAAPAAPRQSGPDPSALAPFARQWRGMREQIQIDATGHGQFHYMGVCASCSMADMPYYTMEFVLTSVSGDTARGNVTVSRDPRFPVGAPVAATMGQPDTIGWSVADQSVGLFCGSDPAYCGG